MTTKHLIVLIGPSGEKVKRKVDSTSRLSALLAAFLSETKRPSDQTAWELYLAEDEECAEELELGATLKEEELDVKVRLRVVEKGAKRPRPKPAAPAVAVAESVKVSSILNQIVGRAIELMPVTRRRARRHRPCTPSSTTSPQPQPSLRSLFRSRPPLQLRSQSLGARTSSATTSTRRLSQLWIWDLPLLLRSRKPRRIQ